jgi:hypothetical protein
MVRSFVKMANCGSMEVVHSPHHPKVEGSSAATAAVTGREKMSKISLGQALLTLLQSHNLLIK